MPSGSGQYPIDRPSSTIPRVDGCTFHSVSTDRLANHHSAIWAIKPNDAFSVHRLLRSMDPPNIFRVIPAVVVNPIKSHPRCIGRGHVVDEVHNAKPPLSAYRDPAPAVSVEVTVILVITPTKHVVPVDVKPMPAKTVLRVIRKRPVSCRAPTTVTVPVPYLRRADLPFSTAIAGCVPDLASGGHPGKRKYRPATKALPDGRRIPSSCHCRISKQIGVVVRGPACSITFGPRQFYAVCVYSSSSR